MKTRNIIIILVVVAVLGIGAFVFIKTRKKVTDLNMLQYMVKDFQFPNLKIEKLTDIPAMVQDIMDGATALDLQYRIINNSNSEFKINSLMLKLYALDGQLLASPRNPISEIIIAPKSDVVIDLNYSILTSGVIHLAKQIFGNESAWIIIPKLLKNYFVNNEMGTQAILKGSITAENIPVPININETIDI